MFSLVSKLVNGVKGGVVAGLQGTADVASSVVHVAKNTTLSVLKETGEFGSVG